MKTPQVQALAGMIPLELKENKEPIVKQCNPLFFPQGNELGNYYEAYFKATFNNFVAYGNSENNALDNLNTLLKEKKSC